MEVHNVLIVVFWVVALISIIGACFIIKKRVSFCKKTIFSVCFLLVGGIAVILTGAQETSTMTYVGLLAFTVCRIILRLIWNVTYNFTLFVFSKTQKREFKSKTIEEIEHFNYDNTDLYSIVVISTIVQLILGGLHIFALIYDIIH